MLAGLAVALVCFLSAWAVYGFPQRQSPAVTRRLRTYVAPCWDCGEAALRGETHDHPERVR